MMQSIAAPLAVLLFIQLLQPSSAEARHAARSPVEKVVNLLEDMKTKLEQDQDIEQQTYDKYACWCEKATARKAASIDQGRADLRSLGQEILIQRGIVAQKTIEIEETTQDIKANEEAQEAATAIRQKENEAYMTESAELKQAITALEKAVIVLRDAAGFLQQGSASRAGERVARELASLQDKLAAVPAHALEKLAQPGDTSKLALLSSYVQKMGQGARYTPQSATIQGILKDMYDTFASDLETMDSDEAEKNRAFEDFIATKQEELLQLQKKLSDAQKAKAEAELMLAEVTQSYDDTEEQLKADVVFFDATKSACTTKSEEWKERKTLRVEELAAVTQALEILSSDDARELFGSAINTPGVQQTFLQLSNIQNTASSVEEMAPAPLRRAYRIVKDLATSGKSLRLARLAASVHSAKAGHFDTVIAAIDTMIGELRQEAKDDVAKRDQCKDEYQKIESKSKDLEWTIKNNEAAIAKLAKIIEELGAEKARTLEKIQEVGKAIEDLNATRVEENEAYHQAKGDDEEAIQLLEDAKAALAGFYKNNSIELGPMQNGAAGMLQSGAGPEFERSADDAPEAEFSHKGKRKSQAKGVISLLTHIIEDLHGEIAVAMKSEEAAQLEYEKQLKAAQDVLLKLGEKKVHLESSIAERGVSKSQEEDDKTENEGDLKSEEDYKKEIEPDCDFIVDKFSERVAKRTAEIDGLTQAKEYLVGYQESAAAAADTALLQGRTAAGSRPFDDDAFARISLHGLK